MTLATPDLQPPRRAPPGVIDPIGVARREAALLEVVRAHPGATLPDIAKVADGSRGAVIDRLRRLAARGAVVKVAGRWRLAGEEPVPPDSPVEPATPEPEPVKPGSAFPRWVRPLAEYERRETTIVEGLRYG